MPPLRQRMIRAIDLQNCFMVSTEKENKSRLRFVWVTSEDKNIFPEVAAVCTSISMTIRRRVAESPERIGTRLRLESRDLHL